MDPCQHHQRRRDHAEARRYHGVGCEHYDHEHKGRDHKILKHKDQARTPRTYPYPAWPVAESVAACGVKVGVAVAVGSLVFVAMEVAVAVALEIVGERVARKRSCRGPQARPAEAKKSWLTKSFVGESLQIHGSAE